MSHSLLTDRNLIFSAEKDIRSICNPLLSSFGIVYFNYLRAYDDGSCYLLTTHSNLIKYVFDYDIPVAAPIEKKLIKKNFNYFILPIGKYDQLVHFAKVDLNLAHFIDLVDRYDDYIELFCFGSTSDNSEIVNFYMNNLDLLNQFKIYFKEQAADLLKIGQKNKILLPEVMHAPYKGLHYSSDSESNHFKILGKTNYYLTGKYQNIKLTRRQYDCLSQLVAGCTAKEAAKNLNISPRTFENYLANLKTILACHRKSQLINIVLKYRTSADLFSQPI